MQIQRGNNHCMFVDMVISPTVSGAITSGKRRRDRLKNIIMLIIQCHECLILDTKVRFGYITGHFTM